MVRIRGLGWGEEGSEEPAHTPSLSSTKPNVLTAHHLTLIVLPSLHLASHSLASQVDVLAAQVAEAEARCERENNDEFSKKREELSKREESLNEEVKIIGETTEEIQKRINMYKEEAKAETAAMEECESTKMEEIPRIKHAISLYANITGIKFDYSKEGKLAGHIAIPQSEEVHSFNIDAAKCSGFEIANQLWGMMEPPACE